MSAILGRGGKKGWSALIFLGLLSACAYSGGTEDVANPLVRKATWFDFVGGGDLRRACRPGAPENYRFVYNADYEEQIRIYSFFPTKVGAGLGAGRLESRVLGQGNLALLRSGDDWAPWHGKAETHLLSPEEGGRLWQGMLASGLFEAPPKGLQLRSEQFYWTAAACHDGHFYFSAWLYPPEGSRPNEFAPLLLSFDQTGVPANPPQVFVETAERLNQILNHQVISFTLQVGGNGLVGQ